MILKGVKKSALLLLSLGSDQASKILKHLTPFEVQEIVTEMVNMQETISNKTLDAILHECYDNIKQNNSFTYSENFIANMLNKALGDKKGHAFLKEALDIRDAKNSIKNLSNMNSERIAFLLKNEHPQIITAILIYLNNKKAAKVLSFFNEKERSEIILRITEFNGIEESSLINLIEVIDNALKNKKLFLSEKGGIKSAANVLNYMKIKDEKETIKNIRLLDKNLAHHLLQEIFLFENIINVDDQCIKLVIKHVEKEKLCIALQDTSEKIQKKFFKNMSEKQLEKISLMLSRKNYFSTESIKNEQKLILIIIRNIIDNGKFSLKKIREYYAE